MTCPHCNSTNMSGPFAICDLGSQADQSRYECTVCDQPFDVDGSLFEPQRLRALALQAL